MLVLGLLSALLALVSPAGPAQAAILGPGTATIPGFVGYVTSSNTELGIGRLPNGSYGVCTDTGAQFPWPSSPTSSERTNPETAYLLTHFMDDAIDNPRAAAALWWATGIDFGHNSQQAAMQVRLDDMRAEAPGIFADVKVLHDRMVAQANRWAAPAGGYTASVNVANAGAADRVEIRQIGVRAGSAWVPDERITVTLEGAKFNATGTSTWTGRSQDAPIMLVAQQSGPGVVKATIRAANLADTTYRVWWGGGNTQRVLARGDYASATASDETLDDLAVARAQKVDVVTGDGLEGAVFRAWVDVNGNRTEEADELGRDLAPTGANGFTSRVNAYRGTQVCFREKTAPAGYIRDRTVVCVAAAPDGNPVAVIEIVNRRGDTPTELVPLIVRKIAEGGDPSGMIGVTVETAECEAGCPAIESYTFTEADFDPAGQFVQHAFSPRYDSDWVYWVRVVGEPAGWAPEAYAVQAALEPNATFFFAQVSDRRLPVPGLVTQISNQNAGVGDTITDAVTVTGTGGATITGYWRLEGPLRPGLDGDGKPTCAGLDWTGAPVAAQGDFLITGDGVYTVGEYTITEAGCYTYREAGDQTATTGPIPWTAPGIPEETTLVVFKPTLVTQISNQNAAIGETITDAVTVSRTGGATVTGVWRLLGPVTPKLDAKGLPTCTDVNWTDAAVAAQGEFTATGDGTYTVGEFKVEKAGCYTYVEDLKASPTTDPMPETRPGIPEETTLVVFKPTLVTQISNQMGAVGTVLTDAVTVSGTGGATVTGVWRLIGPAAPVMGPNGNTCEGVVWAEVPTIAQGEFTATGDGTYTVGEFKVEKAGCYTYVEDLKATPTTDPMPETQPGIPSETTLITDGPTLVTQISDQTSEVGDVISDTVMAAGTGGATIPARWWVHGPMKPLMSDGKLTCVGVDWSKSKIAAEGEFTITGDGTFAGVGEYKVREAGCYSYREAAAETPTTEAVETLVGIQAETTLSMAASSDEATTSDDESQATTSQDNVSRDDSALPNTGVPAGIGVIGGSAVLALLAGLALAGYARTRRRDEVLAGRHVGSDENPGAGEIPTGVWPGQ